MIVMVCTKGCGRTRDDSEFLPNKNICKPCNAEYHRQYRAKYKEKLNQYQRDRYANSEIRREQVSQYVQRWREENPERYAEYRKEYGKQYREDNAEKVKANTFKWREDNPDKVKAYSRLYYQENRDKILEYSRNYYVANRERLANGYKDWYWNRGGKERKRKYAQENAAAYRGYANLRRARKYDPSAEPFSWQEILDRDGAACYHCGSLDGLEQDHLVPISRDGKHRRDNVSVLCGTCNRSKGSKLPDELPQELQKSVQRQIERIKDEPK